jgi:hypothetical protein
MELVLRQRHVDPSQLLVRPDGTPAGWTMMELRVTAEVPALFGPPHWTNDDPFGPPSPERGWSFVAPCGLIVNFRQWYVSRDGHDVVGANLLLAPCRAELEHARAHLPFATEPDGSDELPELPSGYALDRLDDNGNTTRIGIYPRRASAECVRARLSWGGHKQTYSIAVFEPVPRTVADDGRWAVWRLDDGGVRHLVTRHAVERHALEHVAVLEEEPRHKNTYVVEPWPPK